MNDIPTIFTQYAGGILVSSQDPLHTAAAQLPTFTPPPGEESDAAPTIVDTSAGKGDGTMAPPPGAVTDTTGTGDAGTEGEGPKDSLPEAKDNTADATGADATAKDTAASTSAAPVADATKPVAKPAAKPAAK